MTARPVPNERLGCFELARRRRGTWPIPKGCEQRPHTSRPAKPRSAFTDQLPQWGQAMASEQRQSPVKLHKVVHVHLSSLLDELEACEPVMFTRRGKAITELMPRRPLRDLLLQLQARH